MEMTIYIVVTLFGTPAVTAFLAFLSKEKIKSYFFVDAQKAINSHKQELDTYTEAMKHGLQREIIKVEYSTRNKFTIYPKMYARLIKAHGKLSGLYGLRHNLDRSMSTADDVREALESRNVIKGEIDRIIAAYEADASLGIKQLEEMLREIEVNDAHSTFIKAKNFLLLNELFMSQAIAREIDGVLGKINQLRATAITAHKSRGSGERWFEKFFEQEKEIPPLLEDLRNAMRNELNPINK
jgi:hypothetical protein